MSIVKKPWEFGEAQEGSANRIISIPDFCVGNHTLVRLAPPKGKGVREGLVTGFIMTSYIDVNGETIELVTVNESISGYQIEFPLGKRGLYATKYRGPNNQYRFLDKESNKFYQIPSEKFTLEGATKYCEENVKGWSEMADAEKDLCIDEYFSDMFMFGMSQDLALPAEGDNFTEPFVGLQTKLYRTYTPPAQGEKWGNIIISKWRKGFQGLDPAFETRPEALAVAIYEEYQKRDNVTEIFDPTKLEETDDAII